MIEIGSPSKYTSRPIQIGVIALYVLCAATILRGLYEAYQEANQWFFVYLGLASVFFLLFILLMLRPTLPVNLIRIILALQSAMIVSLVSLPVHLDYLTALFVLLSYQMALVLTGRERWFWCAVFCLLSTISLILWFGWVLGVALMLTPLMGIIVFLTYVIANREEEWISLKNEAMLMELQEKNASLQTYAENVEQIAAIEERNHLAVELHDSVSQIMFSILLNVRATQILLVSDPERVRPQLEQLQALSQAALSEMRSLIAQLRPQIN